MFERPATAWIPALIVLLVQLASLAASSQSTDSRGQAGAPEPGRLGEALRNLQRYIEQQREFPPEQGDDVGATVSFAAKGPEFDAWLRTFIAQMRRNWIVPPPASTAPGRVVIRFNVSRQGQISDVSVVEASPIEVFTAAARRAIVNANPTAPLPPEYPEDRATFTITFRYNEQPPRTTAGSAAGAAPEFSFTGPAEYYTALGLGYELLSGERITQEGLRFFVLGTDSYGGKTYTKVRVRSRQGTERTGWINRVPPTPKPTPAEGVAALPGFLVAGPPPPPPAGAVRVGGAIPPPVRTRYVPPVYPPIAQAARVQGVVILEAVIGPDGKVRDAHVVRSIPLLDQSALDAVRQWEFTPVTKDGAAVPAVMSVVVQFSLADAKPPADAGATVNPQ